MFHEAALLLNRVELPVSVLLALVEMDLDQDRNVDQVIRQLCSFLADVYQYLDARTSQIRRRTVSLPHFALREVVHSANLEDHPLLSKRNSQKTSEALPTRLRIGSASVLFEAVVRLSETLTKDCYLGFPSPSTSKGYQSKIVLYGDRELPIQKSRF